MFETIAKSRRRRAPLRFAKRRSAGLPPKTCASRA